MATIDVMMPVKNGLPFLAESIDSIRNQSFTDWRLLVLDHGSDLAAIADGDIAQDLGISAEFHIIADDGSAAVLFAVSDGHALPQRAIASQDRLGMDENPAEMPDAQAAADQAAFRQADARQGFDDPEQKPIKPCQEIAAQSCGQPVDPAPEAVDADGPKRLLLEQGAGRGDARNIGLPIHVTRPEHA
jgi:glycosyltransferase involved in cell wall biosynthesis